MISLLSKFLHRVRIHGGEFDASARAMHRKAAIENVSVATIERTTMSKKTTMKRVALVAVAAMGFGLLSVAPSSATFQADALTIASATGSTTVNTATTASLTESFLASTIDSVSVTATFTTAPAGAALTQLPVLSSTGGSTNALVTAATSINTGDVANVQSIAAGSTVGKITATFTPTVAGTYVIKFTPLGISGGTVAATAVTWTVTVAAEGVATTADSTWGMIAGVATPVQGTHTAVTVAKTLPAAQVATIKVTPLKAGGAALSTAIKLSATISGPGTLGVNTTSTTTSSGRAITSASAGDYFFGVFNDGTAGVATITITSPEGAVLATATVNFSDSLASYTATGTKTVIGVGSTDAYTIAGKDAAGVTAVLGTYYASSATTSVATVSISGATVTVTGVAPGTSVITIGNAASAPTISTTFTVTVGKATIKTLTMTTDKSSYAAGEKVTVTVTALGSDGTAVGDATLNAFSAAVTSNLAVQGTLPTAAIAFVGGVKTFVIYAPANAGTVTLTGTEGSSTDNVIAGGTAATITASFDVTNPGSDAATDAANAATDAANYAADAADAATTAAQEATAAAVAAQESADAATAAVVALGLRVDSLLASVRAQLTSIANLIKRILAKKK